MVAVGPEASGGTLPAGYFKAIAVGNLVAFPFLAFSGLMSAMVCDAGCSGPQEAAVALAMFSGVAGPVAGAVFAWREGLSRRRLAVAVLTAVPCVIAAALAAWLVFVAMPEASKVQVTGADRLLEGV